MNSVNMKRITVTLPDAAYAELEDWAEQQGRPVANLATFLIELGLRQGKQSGEYKPSKSKGD
ncbi:ribbon-helix-helix domain-containing protein [Egbenema bharatensis]|uniref:ribbon-helix-helix domain-containing protein n=1 Tax=Egbenema bharatensis TaxID=3463334 RepID=UPI003A85CCA7